MRVRRVAARAHGGGGHEGGPEEMVVVARTSPWARSAPRGALRRAGRQRRVQGAWWAAAGCNPSPGVDSAQRIADGSAFPAFPVCRLDRDGWPWLGVARAARRGAGAARAVRIQVLLGDMGAGKSSLVLRFVKGQFFDYQESTIGAAFLTQTVSVNDVTVKFEIWDTAGQERYHSLAPMYYRGAAAAIIVFDITRCA